jgi:pyrroloquinoline quinone (PQQ) biosynthesis protein C
VSGTASVVAHAAFKKEVDELLRDMVQRFYREIEGADHLLESQEINLQYYRRHLIEIILRLRMKRWIDALTIHYFTKHDPRLAKKWCAYTEDEMLHDAMFAKDLEKIGVSREEIYANEPLFTTKLLQGYFYYGLEHEGRPLASLSSSYFIENVSLMTQPAWIKNVENALGTGMARGQQAHVDHDLEDDHTDFVWDVLMTFVQGEDDKRRIVDHITNVYKLFCAFYLELYYRTVRPDADPVEVLRVLARP